MVLDTCFCIDFMREQKKNVYGGAHKKLELLDGVPVFLPVFVLCELMAGAKLAKNPTRELRRVELFKEYIDIIYPGEAFPLLYANTEAFLRKKGTPIASMDLLIAISAISQASPLLTKNVKDFQNIPNLIIETY